MITSHLLPQQPHGREGSADDSNFLLLQVGHQIQESIVTQIVVAVGQDAVNRAHWNPVGTQSILVLLLSWMMQCRLLQARQRSCLQT